MTEPTSALAGVAETAGSGQVWAVLAVVLAVVALLVAWGIFREQQSTQRRGVIAGVSAELRLHEPWVGGAYDPNGWPSIEDPLGWWARDRLLEGENPTPLVYRLSTVATDAAIQSGPGLFVNPRLVSALVEYRQRVANLNQMIDNAMALQSGADFWTTRAGSVARAHFAEATARIHWVQIGDANSDGAYAHFMSVNHELSRERVVGRRAYFLWFWFGRTLHEDSGGAGMG
ncbi:MAG: hypothetical protein ABSE52_10625 [Candidatus Dormibacteria bacterium]|jgi:hypothetical protein